MNFDNRRTTTQINVWNILEGISENAVLFNSQEVLIPKLGSYFSASATLTWLSHHLRGTEPYLLSLSWHFIMPGNPFNHFESSFDF